MFGEFFEFFSSWFTQLPACIGRARPIALVEMLTVLKITSGATAITFWINRGSCCIRWTNWIWACVGFFVIHRSVPAFTTGRVTFSDTWAFFKFNCVLLNCCFDNCAQYDHYGNFPLHSNQTETQTNVIVPTNE